MGDVVLASRRFHHIATCQLSKFRLRKFGLLTGNKNIFSSEDCLQECLTLNMSTSDSQRRQQRTDFVFLW